MNKILRGLKVKLNGKSGSVSPKPKPPTIGKPQSASKASNPKDVAKPSTNPKVFLIAGHGGEDPGAYGCGKKEADLTLELRNLIEKNFSKTWQVMLDNEGDRLSKVVSWLMSNSTKQDFIVDIHFNAGPPTATGVEVFIADNHSTKEKLLAKDISQSIANILEIKNRGVKTESQSARGKLAIFRPYGIKVLIEVCFITNSADVSKYLNKKKDVAMCVSNLIKAYASE